MHRLFVAVELPESVKNTLILMAGGVPGAKWRTAEQLHVTVRFIGEVDGGMARDIHDVLEQVKAPGFRLALRGIGHFGDRKHPRTLWAGVDNAEPVKFLHDRVERALTSVGLAPESRKFRPHVTLARLQGARMPAVTAFESRCNSFASEPFAVDRFVLFSSFLAGEGAIYTAEAEYPLAPSA